MRIRAIHACLAVVVCLHGWLLAACNTDDGNSNSGTQDVAFSVNVTPAGATSVTNLVTFTADETQGRLRALSALDLQASQGAFIIALPHGKSVFAVVQNTPTSDTPRLKTFTVDKALARITSTCADVLLNNRSQVGQPVLTPQETFVLVPSSTFVDVFHIDGTTGCVTGTSSAALSSSFTAQYIAIDSTGTNAYVLLRPSGTGADAIQRFTLNQTAGLLSAQETVTLTPLNPGSTFIDLHPSRQFVFVTSAGSSGSNSGGISGVTLDSTGTLIAPIGGLPFPETIKFFAIHPSGQFLYGVSASTNRLSGFTINPMTGTLTRLSGLPTDTLNVDDRLSFSPNGNFAYIGNNAGFFVYLPRSDGILTPVPGLTLTNNAILQGQLGRTWDKLYIMAL